MVDFTSLVNKYFTEREGQYDVDGNVFVKAIAEVNSGDDVIQCTKEMFHYAIMGTTDHSVQDLVQECEL